MKLSEYMYMRFRALLEHTGVYYVFTKSIAVMHPNPITETRDVK